MLDSALLRPGRFDRQVTVDRPDVAGRVKILKVHSRGKQIGKDVDFDKVARRTPGELSHHCLALHSTFARWLLSRGNTCYRAESVLLTALLLACALGAP